MSEHTNGSSGARRVTPETANGSGSAASRYLSIFVPPSEAGGGTDKDGYSYLRLGAPDDAVEGKLPPAPNNPTEKGARTRSPFQPGITLYTTGAFQSKSLSTAVLTSEDARVITTENGDHVLSAEMAGGSYGDQYAVSYKYLNEFVANVGADISAHTGLDQNAWTGLYTHFGVGSSMEGSYGLKVDLKHGKSVELEGGWFHLGGVGGHFEAAEHHYVAATDRIRLSSSPANEALLAGFERWKVKTAKWIALVGVVSATLLSTAAIAQEGVSWTKDSSIEDAKKTMHDTQIELATVMAVYALIQAGILIAAFLTRSERASAAVAADAGNPDACVLELNGTSPSSAYLKAGSRGLWFDAGGNVRLNNQTPGRTLGISVDAAGTITLSAGRSSIAIDNTGIILSGPLISVAGGASTLTVGAAGINLGSPNIMLLPAPNAAAITLAQEIDARIGASAAAAEAAEVAGVAANVGVLQAWAVKVAATEEFPLPNFG